MILGPKLCFNSEKRKKHLKESKSFCTAWTYIWIQALREVDLEQSAKREINRITALVSFNCLKACILNSFLTKSQTIQPRQTRSDHLGPEKSLTKSPNFMLYGTSKQSFPKLPGQLMPMTVVISEVVTPTGKTKSNPLAREKKVRILSKFVIGF